MYSRMFRLRRLQRRKNFRTIPIFRQKRQNTTEPKSSTEGGSLNVFQVLLGFCAGAAGMYLLSPSDSRSFASQQVTIPVGHVGVIEKNGKIDPVPLESGSHWISYISKYYLFDTRTKMLHLTVEVPSKEGLSVSVEVAALYHLDPKKAAVMYETVGTDYEGLVVQPQFRAAIKQVCTGFDSKDFYHANTLQEISNLLTRQLSSLTEKRGIMVEEIVVKRIALPPMVQEAIEQKLKMEQEMQQMQFVLEKEEAEAKRKAIEAKGVADFQKIVSEGISEELLLWKGIEATEKLALSKNSKIVIIGSGDHGLPVILHAESYKEKSKNNNQKLKTKKIQDEKIS